MPVEVIMPKVDMDMATGTLATWHITEGASVEKGEPLFDIETDKSTMEVESPATGSLQFITASTGDVIEIGKCIAWIFAEGEALAQPASNNALEAAQDLQSTPGSEQEGSEQESSEQKISEQKSSEQKSSAKVANGAANEPGIGSGEQNYRATPLARRIAKQRGIALSLVRGTGPLGRITRKDVEGQFQTSQVEIQNEGTANSGVAEATPANSLISTSQLDAFGIDYETIPVDRMRRTIAERLTLSKSTVPHFYLECDCRVDRLLEYREQVNFAQLKLKLNKISINDMIVRACAQGLIAVPDANASWAGDEIIRYKDANISVAVSVEGGLLTPVVRKAQAKSLNKISTEIADLATRARSGKLKRAQSIGGCMSVSNLGMHGVKSFSAIINPPESMILAVGAANRKFVEDEQGKPVAGTFLTVVLSCDHRVVDGVLGARWLSEFKRIIENPALLAMGFRLKR